MFLGNSFAHRCPLPPPTRTGADHFFTKQLDAVEETLRGWAEEILGT
jgi:alpha/beta superfamily hydrolase